MEDLRDLSKWNRDRLLSSMQHLTDEYLCDVLKIARLDAIIVKSSLISRVIHDGKVLYG
ncbi:MAG: hypothetical protein NW214_00730 [Pseudanabaenaceae cyanobacterium bins.39]|nr:hypothetical protein [Pseudanabaenaceae cyanobacterium bins.39]